MLNTLVILIDLSIVLQPATFVALPRTQASPVYFAQQQHGEGRVDLRTQLNEQAQSGAAKCLGFEMPVRWGDLDAMKHVNNTVYFRYMEEARVHYASACGLVAPERGRDIVLASVNCDFLRPILWPATVQIDTRLVRVGRSSLECAVDISVKGEDGPSARGKTVVVGVDPVTGRSSPWTQAELEAMARVFMAA